MDHGPWTMDFLKLFYISLMNLHFVSRLLIRLGIALIIVYSLFTIMHWPYLFLFPLAGFGLIGVGYLFRFYQKSEKSALDYIKLGLIEFWVLQGIFRYMEWPGYRGLAYTAIVFIVAWLIMGGPKSYFESQNLDKGSFLYKWSIPVLGVLIVVLGVGALFNIMHWPLGDTLSTIGWLGTAVWVLVFTFQTPKRKNESPS